MGNDSAGVFCEIEGSAGAVQTFVDGLRMDAPPWAVVQSVTTSGRQPTGQRGFEIVSSRPGRDALTLVSADLGPCAACLAELADPNDRRYRYPLLNCTDCGPRFTITTDVPYDRMTTTMAPFRLCALCQAEYDDPYDRRFHAQPTACPSCGPRLWWEHPIGDRVDAADPVTAAVALIDAGGIVAVKGAGGYHLACRADADVVVAKLRNRKHRPDKPLAVLVADLMTAKQIAHVSPAEAALLDGPDGDPFARDVVEAYWIGSQLLAGVDPGLFAAEVEATFKGQPTVDWGRVERALPFGVAHHSFQVLVTYPWLGLLDRPGGHAIRILDRCRIRWGQVQSVSDASIAVDSQPLTYADGRLSLGSSIREDGLVVVQGSEDAPLAPGDWVAMHWEWVCDRLASRQLEDLQRYSADQLAMVNEVLLTDTA